MRRFEVCVALFAIVLAACGQATEAASEQLTESGPPTRTADSALSFDGVDDYVSTGTARMPQIERPQTYLAWVKPAAGGDGFQVVMTLRRSDYSGIGLGLDALVPIAYHVLERRDLARSPKPLDVDRWQHLAYVLDDGGSHLYVNGVQVASGPPPGTNRTPVLAFLGSKDGYRLMFHGELDEVYVYDRAFSAAEVADVASGRRPDTEPLVLYLPFDETEGSRSYDRSGLGNHAVLGDGVVELMPSRVPSDVPHQ